MPKFYAIVNVPGYLSMDDEPPVFDTAQEAWAHLADERRLDEDGSYDGGPLDAFSETAHELKRLADDPNSGPGSLHGWTPGYDGDHDLGLAYTVQAEEA